MQENLLDTNPDSAVNVYIVWEPMLRGNRNHAADAIEELIPDERVKHYWNDSFIAGEFFREHRFGETAWDIYFLYGPEAVWKDTPEPLLSSGFTIIRERRALDEAFTILLEEFENGNEANQPNQLK